MCSLLLDRQRLRIEPDDMFHVERVGEVIKNNLNLTIATATTAASLALFYLYRGHRQPVMEEVGLDDHIVEETISLDNQTFEIEPGVRCSRLVPDGQLMRYYIPEVTTTYEVFCYGINVSDNGPCLGERTGPALEYKWITYQQVYDEARQLGSAFIEKGIAPNNNSFVGICASNCPQWVVTEQACAMFSMVVVPVYDTLGLDALRHIVTLSKMSIIVCAKLSQAKQFVRFRAEGGTNLQCIVVIESIDTVDIEAARSDNVDLVSFQDMLNTGVDNLQKPMPPSPEDTCTVCYTSGTTGDPKGVVLTHENILSNVAAIMKQTFSNNFGPEDVHISYLPLAHMFERMCQVIMFHHGARVGFFRGDVKLLLDDIQTLKPTYFPTVPRLLNRIYNKITTRVQESTVKSLLFNFAFSRKMALLKRGVVSRDTLWDKLVFGRVQQLLGGRVKFIISGSAPLSSVVHEFLRCVFGCAVLEGYGQTEYSAGVTFNLPHEHRTGHVGPVLPCALLKLVSVPDMDYFAEQGRGEVCVKGPSRMKEYFLDPEKTRETIDEDGWLHTGDIGRINEDGTLSIIDRKKHHFKLSQGEYITPEKIEGVYSRSSFVLQVFLDGISSQRFPVAIIVPDPEVALTWATRHGIAETDMNQLCKNALLKRAIFDDFKRLAVEARLKGFEQVHDIYLHREPFSIDNGLLTPTLKNKRLVLRRFFSQEIQTLYND